MKVLAYIIAALTVSWICYWLSGWAGVEVFWVIAAVAFALAIFSSRRGSSANDLNSDFVDGYIIGRFFK